MQTFSAFFKKEIFAEVAMPARPSTKVVIMCDGAPSVPSKRKLSEFFVKKGYAFIHMRYRGTWESKGVFLKKSPEQDLLDVIDELPQYKKIILIGTSFGGAGVLLAARDARVGKVIAVSPVVKWTAPSREEPLPEFKKFMRKMYGQVYRTTLWNKLGSKGFYEPTVTVDGSKILILHAKDDSVVRFKEVAQFAKKTKSTLHVLKRGGHLSTSLITKPALWKKIKSFLSSK